MCPNFQSTIHQINNVVTKTIESNVTRTSKTWIYSVFFKYFQHVCQTIIVRGCQTIKRPAVDKVIGNRKRGKIVTTASVLRGDRSWHNFAAESATAASWAVRKVESPLTDILLPASPASSFFFFSTPAPSTTSPLYNLPLR